MFVHMYTQDYFSEETIPLLVGWLSKSGVVAETGVFDFMAICMNADAEIVFEHPHLRLNEAY
jgi:hypothetical protein